MYNLLLLPAALFYLYEVRPPMPSSYICEIHLIKEQVLSDICHLLVPKSIIKCQTPTTLLKDTSPSRLLHIVSTDFLAFRLFCFNIRQQGRQVLYFKLHVDGRKFHYRRSPVVHRWFKTIQTTIIRASLQLHTQLVHPYVVVRLSGSSNTTKALHNF